MHAAPRQYSNIFDVSIERSRTLLRRTADFIRSDRAIKTLLWNRR